MKSRQEIKAIAKAAMKNQRGTSILTMLVFFVIGIVMGIALSVPIVTATAAGNDPSLGVPMVLFYGILFFVVIPMSVNAAGIFIKIYKGEAARTGELFSNFPVNYLRKLGGIAWMSLFTALWSMLLFIPGIIKSFAYSMTPFILADCPNVTAREALKLSMRMTKGHKMNLFVMMLSFIGWHILSAFTLGILSIVFVSPYMYATQAGYYVELRDKAIADGIIDSAELSGRLQ